MDSRSTTNLAAVSLDRRIREQLFEPRSDDRDQLIAFMEFIQTNPKLVEQIGVERFETLSDEQKERFTTEAKKLLGE